MDGAIGGLMKKILLTVLALSTLAAFAAGCQQSASSAAPDPNAKPATAAAAPSGAPAASAKPAASAGKPAGGGGW
jgi:hypothetical protein